jgi:DNA replication protein DnaC
VRVLFERIAGRFAPAGNLAPLPMRSCGAAPWPDDAPKPGRVYCDGLAHYAGPGPSGTFDVSGRCPVVRREESRARLESERERLAGTLAQLAEHGGPSFDGFDPRRHPSAARALGVMQRFAAGRPPKRHVLLTGPTGLGKTRLLLASHFSRLAAGTPSEYVTTSDLRELFHEAANFNEDVCRPAQDSLGRLYRTEVLHLDDLAQTEDDTRGRGEFADGLKRFLDRSRAMRAVATNRSGPQAERHPDLSGPIISRLLLDADVVELAGIDYRHETARSS